MLRCFQVIFLCLTSFALAQAQTSVPTASTNAPAATPPAITAVPLGNVVAQSESLLGTLRDEKTSLAADETLRTVNANLPGLIQRINDRVAEDAKLQEEEPTLPSLQSAQHAWQTLAADSDDLKQSLATRATQVDEMLTEVNNQNQIWLATQTSAQSGTAPVEAVQRIKSVLSTLSDTKKQIQLVQGQIVANQGRVAEQDSRIASALATITKDQDTARRQLFQQDHPGLWAESLSLRGPGAMTEEKHSFQTQILFVTEYLREKGSTISAQLLILFLLTFGFYGIRNVIRAHAEKEVSLQAAARVFDFPFVTAVLFTLLVSHWLYPLAPRLLLATFGAIALIPTIIILRRLVEPALFPILYAIVAAYFADQLRYVLTPTGTPSRLLLIFELLAGSLFLLWMLHSKRLASHPEIGRFEKIIRIYVHVTMLVLIFAGFANVFGYLHLSHLLSKGMLQSSYLTVVFYAAVRSLDALLISVFRMHPLAHFRVVREHRELIYDKISRFISYLACLLWLLVTLELFSIGDPIWRSLVAVLTAQIYWGAVSFSLGALLAFGVTVWASFLISRFLRFILEEEVYPKLNLSRGIPYAASTMVHYTVLVLGFFTSLAVLNIDLSKFAILGGAFGVGLGFGLQNIMNNFVSGIILLFERPIKVGDTLQIDTSVGVVERIGIRASVIRLNNGSEMIIPNGNLISNPVTNWSLSDTRRMIEIPISVTSKVEAQHVLDLLVKTAAADSRILKDPAPQALLTTLTGASLNFRLRAWTNTDGDGMQLTSDLSLAIKSVLAQENITIS